MNRVDDCMKMSESEIRLETTQRHIETLECKMIQVFTERVIDTQRPITNVG